jgi:signal transduction histidine kinase
MVLIFFVCGLAFFVMGLAIALELRHSSTLHLSRGLRLLALFGLLHGLAQWTILFLLVDSEGVTIQGSPVLRTLFVVLSAAAALALMQFGITLITSTVSVMRWLRLVPTSLLAGWVFSFGAPFLYDASTTASAAGPPSADQCVGCHYSASADYVVASKEWLTSADIWSRYLLYLPGSALAAVGFMLQRPAFRELKMPQIGRLSLWAAASFAFSAVVAGIVVPPAPYLPASALNYATFSERLWFPPQILWAVAAVAIAYFVIRILSVFEIERQRQVQGAVAARDIAIQNARVYEQTQQLAVLEERERIARELHDSLAQALGYIGLRAGLAMDRLESDDLPGLRSEIELVEKTAEEAYTDARASILDLRNGSPKRGLIPTLTEYLKRFSLETGIKAEIRLPEGDPPHFASAAEIQLIRVIQEALTNVRKHAGATRAVVRFGRDGSGSTIVSVEDDGRGFEPARVDRAGAHFGLQTMRERTESVGGKLEIDAAPGRGTRVIAVFPLAVRGGRTDGTADKSAVGG